MCQVLSYPVPKLKITGYVVYKKGPHGSDTFISYFGELKQPTVGIQTAAYHGPFHVFRTPEDVKKFISEFTGHLGHALHVFKVTLHASRFHPIFFGRWDMWKPIKTATAFSMTVERSCGTAERFMTAYS